MKTNIKISFTLLLLLVLKTSVFAASQESLFQIKRSDLSMTLEITNSITNGKGLQLRSLTDKNANIIFTADQSLPLFSVEILDKKIGKRITINSNDGWKTVEADLTSEVILFTGSLQSGGENLCIALKLSTGYPGTDQGIGWQWQIVQNVDRYEFRTLDFPQISLRNLGTKMKVFYPYASGVVTENPCSKKTNYNIMYPDGHCSMQWMAVYDETKNTGLYFAMHDPSGAVKNINLDAASSTNTLTMSYQHHLPLNGPVKNLEISSGVWQAFRGDWFDASLLYKRWVKNYAQWYPRDKMDSNGRTDTPQWMKELCVWATSWETPQSITGAMRNFTDALGVPTALHWYNWHQIPFDNDYPHYLPAKSGVKEAITEMQNNNDCRVVPYINGRLWDTRDSGTTDYQYTSLAIPNATKNEDGSVFTEHYGSKESDGSDVKFAVMCPATQLWKDKLAEIILELSNTYGTAGVYLDQIAAQHAVLCYDKTHGHPLAGGSWWNTEIWKTLETIRNELPNEKILTTECNAEPYINVFDGYLTWHFQYQDQVPAFAAVYGGAIQMFGRQYAGTSLAIKMKMAQQLVYGEQIGWLDPLFINNQLFPFFKAIVQQRYKYRDYFYKGEMVRPPKFLDNIPTVSADWQWNGKRIITTDAVMTGAWRKTDENGNTVSTVFFFVNVSDQPVTSRVAIQFDELGLQPDHTFKNPITFAPGVPIAIEVNAKFFVYMNNGVTVKYNFNEVDSFSFSKPQNLKININPKN